MKQTHRRFLLFALLAGVAGWSVWLAVQPPADEAATVELAERPPRPAPSTRTAPPAPPQQSTEPVLRLAQPAVNLFAEQTWFVAPPPPPPPPYVPPPPPQAPALPYVYLGRWLEGDVTTWYLTRGGVPLAVRAGQVLDGTWRLDTVRASALDFTYLPLNQTRSLRTGD